MVCGWQRHWQQRDRKVYMCLRRRVVVLQPRLVRSLVAAAWSTCTWRKRGGAVAFAAGVQHGAAARHGSNSHSRCAVLLPSTAGMALACV